LLRSYSCEVPIVRSKFLNNTATCEEMCIDAPVSEITYYFINNLSDFFFLDNPEETDVQAKSSDEVRADILDVAVIQRYILYMFSETFRRLNVLFSIDFC